MTNPATSAAARKLVERACAIMLLDHPFFATIQLKHPIDERTDIPTLAVLPNGHIFYNPDFVVQQTTNQMLWAVCHEVLHYADGHQMRFKNFIKINGLEDSPKTRMQWNRAGDRWINDTLNQSGVGEKIPGCEDVPGSADKTVEAIMHEVMAEDEKGGGKGKGKGDPGKPSGPMDGDMQEGEMPAGELEELEAQRTMDVGEAAQAAKMRGKLPGALEKFAAATIASKTPWFDVLERFMVSRVKQDTSWARPNRRYAPDFYMPVQDSVGAMGEVVVQVDISGSVSEKEIAHYNGHIKRIVEQCRPSKVHVMYTDTKVQKHETYDNPEDIEIKYHRGGGTCMEAGFKFIEKAGIEPEVVITLTDGYDTYTKAPAYDTVWCVSSKTVVPYGQTIHFELE
jgi:predicted metal-dependent peptidase